MNIPIELLVVFAIIFFVMFWFFLMFIFKKIKIWRYKPENDKGRRAEESRRAGLANIQRPILPEGRSVFQTTSSNSSGKDSPSIRKSRNPFRRR